MDTDSVHDEFVFGLDNADFAACSAGEGPLLGLDLSAVVGPEVAFQDYQQKATAVHLDREADKAEIMRLKNELIKSIAEIQTLRACNTKIRERNQTRTPGKSHASADSRSKAIGRLQNELQEKAVFCENLSGKLKYYRSKYKTAKKTLAEFMIKPDSVLSNHILQLQQENRQLMQKLDLQRTGIPGVDILKSAEDRGQADKFGIIYEKLKAKAKRMEGDARGIVSSVDQLKEILKEVSVRTPSTSLHDEERLILELGEGNLGKRDMQFDHEDYYSSINSGPPNRDHDPESVSASMEEEHIRQPVAKDLSMQLEAVLPAPPSRGDC